MSLAACGEANDTEFATTRTGGSKNVQDKGRGSLTRPPASHTAPQSGSGIFHRWSEFLLWQVAVNEENRGKTVSFHHFTRWLSQVVFRDFAEISAGVIFHPLGSNRGLVFPLLLQPPGYCRFQAGICAEFDAQKTKKKYCHKMHQRLQIGRASCRERV